MGKENIVLQRASINSIGSEEFLLVVDSDERITCISPACVNILHTDGDPVGQKLEDIMGNSSELLSACREIFIRSNGDLPSKIQFNLENETASSLLATLYPIKRDGSVTGVVIILWEPKMEWT